MVGDDLFRQRLQRPARRYQLVQDLGAVIGAGDHLLDAIQLPGDLAQANLQGAAVCLQVFRGVGHGTLITKVARVDNSLIFRLPTIRGMGAYSYPLPMPSGDEAMDKKHPPTNCRIHEYAPDRGTAERNTRRVIALTAVMMVVEILAGWRFHSMALLADGWHMGTHVAAFLIAAIAYALARRHKGDRSFSFGTGKIDVLGGYTSAVILGIVALFMVVESLQRLFEPLAINYNETIGIGLVGLCVNVASALLLKHDHGHGHDHGHHDHAHDHHHHGMGPEDLNLKAAYVHVIADAVT